MITAGIDVGSITAKVAILKDGQIIGDRLIPTGYSAAKAGKKVFKKILSELKIDRGAVTRIIATGYGRNSVTFADNSITEITCHAAGAHFINPKLRSIIDIGGQDSKAIVTDKNGKVLDFAMNDKCAAGTGRFLEVMARALELDISAFGNISQQADRPANISSLCTVFAESEVISLIANGESRQNIIAGIHKSISSRVMAMASRIGLPPPIMMTGGVAKNSGVVRAFEEKCGQTIEVSPKAQIVGAIGAALIGARKSE